MSEVEVADKVFSGPDTKDSTDAESASDINGVGSTGGPSRSWTTTKWELWAFYTYYVVGDIDPDAVVGINALMRLLFFFSFFFSFLFMSCRETMDYPDSTSVHRNSKI